jgi:hypothetical protein
MSVAPPRFTPDEHVDTFNAQVRGGGYRELESEVSSGQEALQRSHIAIDLYLIGRAATP